MNVQILCDICINMIDCLYNFKSYPNKTNIILIVTVVEKVISISLLIQYWKAKFYAFILHVQF